MTEGQPRGHAVRTCLLAQRIGADLGLSESDLTHLFYAALLKDSGCSTNAVRIQQAFGGDELENKRDVKFVDWSNFLKSAWYGLSHAERGAPAGVRLRKMLDMAKTPTGLMDEVTAARCSRGADIARQLGFDVATSDAVRHLDEHWDGRGSPSHLRGDRIPVLARILCLCQTMELFASVIGVPEAVAMVRRRKGRWFDPEVAQAAIALEHDHAFWLEMNAHGGDASPELTAPADAQAATDADVDEICLAFASIVDAKSGFTGQHSTRVTEYSVAIAARLGIGGERLKTLRRAALLHDLGKLGISNAILDKPGKLTDEEFTKVRMHPRYSHEILARIRGFERITEIASAHHERLDGRGYWRGLSAEHLDLDMRIVAAADVYDALTAKRPYRDAMPATKALSIMREDEGRAFDPVCIEALTGLYVEEPAVAYAG